MAHCMSCGIKLPEEESYCQTCSEYDEYFAEKIAEALKDIENGNLISQEEFFEKFEDMLTQKK